MNKFIVIFVLFASAVLAGCASEPPQTPARQQIVLPAWEDEQAVAENVIWAQYIASASFILRKHINNRWEIFSYIGQLYDFPVRLISGDLLVQFGLTVRGFPRQGSRDHQIMWESIRHFKRESGARPGDYLTIRINRSLTQADLDANRRGGIYFLYFVGRIETDGDIRGEVWRRP